MSIQVEIREKILEILPGAEIEVSDPMCDNAHFEAVVIAKEFEGMSLIERHQMVMNALKTNFATNLHALGLKTFTPKEKNGTNT
ncbi:MAG: BolA/IbaG family iron-sulfur metabolism protein [Candidatus Algichlamydia australiensis]|nr:BolA/IbaG family iron-sulfur metabolism protein [Chlamydiales bacterium]